MKVKAAQMFSLFFDEDAYLRHAKTVVFAYEPATSDPSWAAWIPSIKNWRMELLRDLMNSFIWVGAGCLVAILACAANGKIAPDLPFSAPKFFAAIGAWLAAWPTWFALASVTDTWDMDSRIDLILRKDIFKVLFFPGFILALTGAIW